MRAIMRNAVLVAGAMLLGSVASAPASPTTVLEANVPFQFVVNGHYMPAGRYRVERDDMSSSVLVIRGERGNTAVTIVPTMPDGGHDPAGSEPALTFKRHEQQYRLTGVWDSASEGWDIISR